MIHSVTITSIGLMDDEWRKNRKSFTTSVNAFDEEQFSLFVGASMNHLQNLWLYVASPQASKISAIRSVM